jgi:CDP-glucose 4,6-dehydratase
MHFLITGHTGFKGTWLSLLLAQRGHRVSGISLQPERGSLFERAAVGKILETDIRCDVRDSSNLASHFGQINPDVVIHLAAQALVRESYKNPVITFETNVIGTLNVLKSSQKLSNLRAQLIVTTDKVYRNVGKSDPYIESDPLGGQDPYSASKAMADIAAQSWVSSFENAPTAIARAGNVIGGGDICADRLIPDLMNSYSTGQTPRLRAPNSVRPWQHVLDCLNGYLHLVDALVQEKGQGSWNFGPEENQIHSVSDVANIAGNAWGAKKNWEHDMRSHPYEETMLLLNSKKANTQLGWFNRLDFSESVRWTANWYRNVHHGNKPYEEMLKNIEEFDSRKLESTHEF